jgi:hypothetical protein
MFYLFIFIVTDYDIWFIVRDGAVNLQLVIPYYVYLTFILASNTSGTAMCKLIGTKSVFCFVAFLMTQRIASVFTGDGGSSGMWSCAEKTRFSWVCPSQSSLRQFRNRACHTNIVFSFYVKMLGS